MIIFFILIAMANCTACYIYWLIHFKLHHKYFNDFNMLFKNVRYWKIDLFSLRFSWVLLSMNIFFQIKHVLVQINRLTSLKTCVRYFSFFHQMIALQKLWKMLFISSKKLFSFSRCSNFRISVVPSLSPCRPLL